MSTTATTFASMLKRYYLANDKVQNIARKGRQALSMLKKKTDFGGEEMKVPVLYSDAQLRSASYAFVDGETATASGSAAKTGASSQTHFTITRKKNYASVQITREAIKASASDKLAFMKARTSQIDSMINQMSNDIERDLFRDGTGLLFRAKTSSAVSGSVVTLNAVGDAFHAEKGMYVIAAASTATNATIRDTASANVKIRQIAAVDRAANTITLDDVTNVADGDYFFVYGDGPSQGTAGNKKLNGFAAWLPETVSGSDSFNGVNRSVDRERLAGVYYDADTANDTIEEALINAGARLQLAGGQPDVVFVNPLRFAELAQELDNSTERSKVQSDDGKVSFKSIVVHTGAGSVDVVAAPFCQYDTAWMLQLDTWFLASLDDAPHLVIDDGGAGRAASGVDAINVQCAAYLDLVCTAPGKNCRILLN